MIANKEGKKLYHPQVKTTGLVSLDTLAEEVNANSCRLRVVFRPATTRNSDRTVATRTLVTGANFKKIDSLVTGSGSSGNGSTSGGSGSEGNGDDLPTYD